MKTKIKKMEKRMKKCELCGAKGRIVQSDNLFYSECTKCGGSTAMLSDLGELVALWNYRIPKCIEAVHFGSEKQKMKMKEVVEMKNCIEKVKKNLNKAGLKGTNNNFMRKFSPHEMINWVTSGLDLAVNSESTMDLIVETVKNAEYKFFQVKKVYDYDYTCSRVSEDYYFLANEGFLYLISPVWWAEKGRRGCDVLIDADDDIDISGVISIVEHDTPTGEAFCTLKVR